MIVFQAVEASFSRVVRSRSDDRREEPRSENPRGGQRPKNVGPIANQPYVSTMCNYFVLI